MISDRINEKSPWQDITEGTQKPVHDPEKCRDCYLCVPVCPDMSIIVNSDEKIEFDMDHCKGCGICAKVCPFDAIKMEV